MNIDTQTIPALARIIATAQEPQSTFAIPQLKPAPYVIVPDGHKVEYLLPADLPEEPTGTAILQAAESFVHYVTRFKQPETTLSINDQTATFAAAFDYHGVQEGAPVYGCRRHWATFSLIDSDPWKFWTALHDKWLTQEKIVELFEERAGEVTEPTIAELLKVAVDFKSTSATEYTTRYDRVTQRTELVAKKEENQRGGESVAPPASLTISIPVFKNGKAFTLTALLSWKGKPDQFVKLRFLNMQETRDTAIEDERTLVAGATGIPVLRGVLPLPS